MVKKTLRRGGEGKDRGATCPPKKTILDLYRRW